MIVVISDLHLQHTKHDSIRRVESGKVLETKVVRNVNASALSLLFGEIAENVERSGATRVELVLAGDIFELHRTPLWFVDGESLRPTMQEAAQSPALEAKVHRILSAIELDNREFFDSLRQFVERGVTGSSGLVQAVVVPHYLPGNHDRLTQLWASTRKRVRALLGMNASEELAVAPFVHQLEWNRAAGYGVRIRHGHEYDSANFSESFDPKHPALGSAYESPAFGDWVTVDIATRLAVAFRVFYAHELRAPGAPGEPYRRIYAALTEFDDVRPQTMLVRYLTDYLGATEQRSFEILRPVLRDVVENAKNDGFFMDKVAGLAHGLLAPAAELIELLISSGSAQHIGKLVALFDSVTNDPSAGQPAKKARAELGLDTGDIFLVIAGHTHQPDHVALPGRNQLGMPGGEAYFLDTGTWRTRLDAGEGGTFGRLRAYTMVFCYHDRELTGRDRRRFETWTGHLMADDFGPMFSVGADASTSDARPAKQTVRFLACQVESIDEGETRNGAELVLFFGVDQIKLRMAKSGVQNGQAIALQDVISVDPALDGELWCHAVEQDGGSYFDPDDAMPWAVAFLERESEQPGAAFVAGQRALRAADNQGNAFSLLFEVLALAQPVV